MARDVTAHQQALRTDELSRQWCRKRREGVPGRKEETHKLGRSPRVYRIAVLTVQSQSLCFKNIFVISSLCVLWLHIDTPDAIDSWQIQYRAVSVYSVQCFLFLYQSIPPSKQKNVFSKTFGQGWDNEQRQSFIFIIVDFFNYLIFTLAYYAVISL